jgi:FMN phosphatase YigB (HAD superfamily)
MKRRYSVALVLFAFIAVSYFTNKIESPEKTLYVSSHFGSTQAAKQAFNKQKPIILWDIHECLFEKPYGAFLWKGIWNLENKPKFIYQFFTALMEPKVRTGYTYHKNRPAYSPQPYFDLVKDHTHLHAQLHKQANIVYTPNKKTFEIVKELHQEDCPQYLFSNIGPVTLNYLQHDYPQYFIYFTQLQNTINPITPPYDQWIQKPDTKAFERSLMTVDMHNKPWMTIFIDDREDNIQKAQEVGMNGIIFVSPEQLHKDLNQLMELNHN